MSVSQIAQSFNAGEISPELYGEVDLKKIGSAATTLRNMIVCYRGSALSRGGLAFVGRCKQILPAAPPRPIPFQFSITQGYVLEFGDKYMRVYQDGAQVQVTPGNAYQIVSPYAIADLPNLQFVQISNVLYCAIAGRRRGRNEIHLVERPILGAPGG